MRMRPVFENKEKRQEINERLNSIDGVHVSEDKLDNSPEPAAFCSTETGESEQLPVYVR